MTCHCPRHGEVLAPASVGHCPLCGLPLLVNADGGHGLRWADDRNRTYRADAGPDVYRCDADDLRPPVK